ncbi:MAG TPA: molybdenum storage protein subunit alpha [Actinomycetota bacterium]|jgi:molybdenum storage protein
MTTDTHTGGSPAPGIKHVPSSLMRQTLLDRDLVLPVTDREPIRLLPWLGVVKLGGRSIMDRGPEAVSAVVSELKEALTEHRLLIATGSGIRSRHIYSVGLDLGLPTGLLASLASTDAEQNGHIIAALLAKQGVTYLPHATVGHQLPVFLAAARGVVTNAIPPYELYEFPPAAGKIPPHRADAGALLIAEAYGARRVVLAEDVDGVYTADPNGPQGAGAELIPKVGARELKEMKLPSLPVDPIVLDLLADARLVKEIQVVNGLKRGTILKALEGEHVGTIIHAD